MSDRYERFISRAEDFVIVPCGRCVHNLGGGKCTAFPDGIPREIITGKTDHRDPYPGDHGIRFELKPGAEDPFRNAIGDWTSNPPSITGMAPGDASEIDPRDYEDPFVRKLMIEKRQRAGLPDLPDIEETP